ncbi:MAG: cyclase family protein [Deltaproteobacteria bacterium]|nr:MAG: cyclase family protein [Deltaproteobacteria bacterium]
MDAYIDLTHPIEKDMPVFPGDPELEIVETMTLGKDSCTVQSIRFSNHLGTHLDAPSHFIEDGITVDEIPLETLIGKAIILDFTDKRKNDLITGQDVQRLLPSVTPGMRVLVRTGWDRNFKSGHFYEGFPCLTLEAAEYFVSLKIRLLGMDTPSPSPLDDPGQEIHKTLLGAGIVLLESVKNLILIKDHECELVVLPMPFKDFSGAPCRVVAK